MNPTTWTLRPDDAQITVQTTAEGMFSPLAHDLELSAPGVAGEAHDGGEGAPWSAALTVPARSLRVVGTVKRGRVHTDVLSAKDKAEIERRVRDDVFAALPELRVTVEGGASGGPVARVSGVRGEVRVPVTLGPVARRPGELAVEGSCALSLRALGLPEVKGPLGAFRVRDEVRVQFRAVLRPAAAATP